MENDIRKMAEEHAKYTMGIIKYVYIEAFIHGVKHGLELGAKLDVHE